MERQEFLTKLGISLAAVCMGCNLASCGSDVKSDDPTPTPTPDPGTDAIISANLDTEIKNIGDFKVAGGVILVRLAQANTIDSFSAVQVACTHQGTSVNYNSAQGKFICPNHFSEFSPAGAVLKGPATTALKKYTVAIAGSALTVTA